MKSKNKSKNETDSLAELNEITDKFLKDRGKVVGRNGFEKGDEVGMKLLLYPIDTLDEFIDTLKSGEEIDAVYRSGYHLLNQGDVKRARLILEKCIEAADHIKYTYGKAWAYAGLGNTFTNTDPKEALANHKIALNIFDELESNAGLARVCTDMALDYKGLNDFDMALKLLNDALKYYEKLNDFDNVGNCCWRIGNMYLNLGFLNKKDYGRYEKKAVTCFKRAEEMYKKTGDDVERARVMRNFADIAFEKGDIKKAREIYKNALDLDKDKNRIGRAFNISGIARTYLVEKNFNKALDLVNEAIEIYDDVNYISDKCDLCLFTADLCHGCGRDDDARRYLQEAKEGYKEIGNKEGLARTYLMLGTICLACGDFKGVKKYGDMAVKADPEIMKKMAEEIKEALRNRK